MTERALDAADACAMLHAVSVLPCRTIKAV